MKTNKKFLGIIMALGLTFSLALGASAANENGYGSIKYSVDGSNSENSNTDVNDVMAFYIVMKKALKQIDMLNEPMKKQILNRVTLGDEKANNNLTLPVTMGGRGIKRDDENIGRAIEIFFENKEQLNKLKEGVKKIDFKKIDITKEDFDDAKKEALQNYEENIKNMKKHLKEENAKLNLSESDLLKKTIKEYEKELNSMDAVGLSKEKQQENKNFIENHIEKLKKFIKELENKKEKSGELKRQLEDLKYFAKDYVGRTTNLIGRYESYIKDFSKLSFDKVKESKNKLNFDNELTNIKAGDYYMH